MPPRVFISYSRNPPDNRARVAQLSARLRSDNVESWIDEYAQEPERGWPIWMEEQIRVADFVLIVCTESYYEALQAGRSGGGRGVVWEANLIRNELYFKRGLNTKYVPVVFNARDVPYIPESLRGFTCYDLSDGHGDYDRLYARINGQLPGPPPLSGKTITTGREDRPTTSPGASCRVVFGTTTDLRSLPHDLASAWALSRGASLGVITGRTRGSLLEILTGTEAVLSSACSNAGTLRLPARTWLAVRPEQHSRVPGDVYEAVAACTVSGSGGARSSTDGVFGFLFEAGTDGSGSALPHITAWCRALFRRTAVRSDIAALIHLPGGEWQDPQARRTVAERLRHAAAEVPVEWMRAIPDADAPAPPATASASAPDPDPLAGWLRGLPPSAAARVPLELGAETPGGHQHPHPPSLRAVAEDVAVRCAGAPQQVRAFLLWAERWSPGDLHGLLRAFAKVGTASVRRVALSVAARADPLVDAWIDGADLRAAAFDEGWFWAADPQTGPFVDDLALGLIRRARAGCDVMECQSLLQRLLRARRLSREMHALVRRWLDDPADHFEHAPALPRAGLALRSGAVYDPPPGAPRRLTLERVDDWKLLLAHPIAPRTLRELLSADAPRRAVFGLCTREEWDGITADPRLVERIMECRGGRSLLFRS